MIIRAIHDRNNPFFLMRRATAQDKRLSWPARGVLAYLFSKHDDWTLRDEDLIAQVAESAKPLGRESLASILKELRVNGYLRRTRKHGKNGQIEWDTEIYETPYTAQPCMADQGMVDQGMAHQGVVHQSMAKPPIIENRKTEERETKKALWELLGNATKYSGCNILIIPGVTQCQFQKSSFP